MFNQKKKTPNSTDYIDSKTFTGYYTTVSLNGTLGISQVVIKENNLRISGREMWWM